MNKLSVFFAQFKKRGGIEVVFSAFGTKLISLIVSIMIARTLSTEDFGLISYALMIIIPLIPLSGLGMDFILLRYGALTEFKSNLSIYTLKHGTLYSFLLICLIFILADVIAVEHKDSAFFIKLTSFLLFWIS
ncbi:oligosaccharide flippase family protein [Psychrosphaera aquimarina]|uniref:Oligosaccharide flippase family protein n=1 Tax=Psychrosphaera aquimarina TaxID=2044854 RepID=A0ABU3R4F5_9GAMM|nr:oligosaccharide flippase family protein [Psychrosphaera aquimarina]MDU0114565.1 oligosaccharide flippase family protein [Psychrosphaera aquimarina]